MKDQLMQSYQELFDIQLSDMEAFEEVKRKLKLTNNQQGIYMRKAQLIDLQAAIDKRSLQLIGLDEKIWMYGSMTVKEVKEKTKNKLEAVS